MLKYCENQPSNKEESFGARHAMRERLRARITRKIRNLPAAEVDENINISNQQPKSVTMTQEQGKAIPLQDHKVRCGLFLFNLRWKQFKFHAVGNKIWLLANNWNGVSGVFFEG